MEKFEIGYGFPGDSGFTELIEELTRIKAGVPARLGSAIDTAGVEWKINGRTHHIQRRPNMAGPLDRNLRVIEYVLEEDKLPRKKSERGWKEPRKALVRVHYMDVRAGFTEAPPLEGAGVMVGYPESEPDGN